MTKIIQKLFVFVLAMMAAPFAFAEEKVWNIYTPAAGSAIFDILTGVAGMLDREGSSSIIGAVLTVSLISFIALVARAGIEGNFVRVLTFFLGLWVLLTTTFSIKVNVMISDRVNNYYTTVSNVPIILAGPAAFISEMGNQLADATDKFMTLPDAMSMRQGGQFNLFAKVLADSSVYKITDPGLNQSITNYINDCTIPGMAQGAISLAKIKTSKDIWSDIKFNHLGLMTRVRIEPTMVTGIQKSSSTSDSTNEAVSTLCSAADKSGCTESLMSCSAAHGVIGTALSLYVSEFGKGTGSVADLGASGNLGSIGSALSAASTWLSGTGAENQAAPGNVLQQRIMLNTMSGAFRAAAVQSGNNELLQAAATTQAEEAQKSAWITSASLFNDLMGYIFIVLQAMIYAIAPFALLLLFAPGSGIRGAVSYLQMLIWIALWEPLLTVVNFMIAVLGKSSLAGAFGSGFDMTNAVAISESANNLMAAAGFMGSMVPLIAWKIATGSLGLMEFVQQGSGQASATQAGATASSGNLSLGNIDLNKMNANSEKFTYGTEFGEAPLMHRKAVPGAGMVSSDAGGAVSSINGQAISYGASVGLSSSSAAELKQSVAYDRAHTLALSTSKNASEMQSEVSAATNSTKSATGSSTLTTNQLSQATATQLSDAVGLVRTSAQALGYSQQFQIGAEVSGGIGATPSREGGGGGIIPKVGFSISGGGNLARVQQLSDQLSSSHDQKSTLSQAWQAIQNVTGAQSMSYSAEKGFTFTKQDGSSFTMSAQEVEQATRTVSNKIDAGYSERLSSDSSVKLTTQLSVPDFKPQAAPSVGNNAHLKETMGSGGGGLQQAVDSVKPSTPAGYQSVVDAARTKLDAHQPKGAPPSANHQPGGSAPAPAPTPTENRRQLVNAAQGAGIPTSLPESQQGRMRELKDVKFQKMTDGHVWDAKDNIEAHDKKGKK